METLWWPVARPFSVRPSATGTRVVQCVGSCLGRAVCMLVHGWVLTCCGRYMEGNLVEPVFSCLYLDSVLEAELRLLGSLTSPVTLGAIPLATVRFPE